MKRLLTTGFVLLLCLMLFACSAPAAEKDADAKQEEAKQTETAVEAAEPTAAPTEVPTEEPTAAPTPEPTEEPTPEPTAEPEYWKYVLMRDELKGSYASTEEAWAAMLELYNLEKELEPRVCGLFLVNWDTLACDYSYRLNGMLTEFLYMARDQAYGEGNDAPVLRVFYEPEKAEVVAPGVIRVASNQWLDQIPNYPPLYFLSLESEDPASGCWIAAYQDVPESVLHPASVTEEQKAELETAVHAKKVADSGLVLSEGELVIDGIDYKALRNHLIDKYLSPSAAHSGLLSALDALEKNPFGKTPNCALFVNWENPNGFHYTGWYMDAMNKAYQKLQKSLKKAPTAEQIMPLTFYPDKVEKLDDYIYRSTENGWLKKAGGSIIWISLDSDDPATGNWIGFYGPVPDTVWE